jgi:small subunit ribosomal protein S6
VREYEAMVIVDATLEEGEIQKAVDKFSAVISDAGGKLTKIDRWGVRRFAYEIAHKKEGYYFVAEFSAPETTVVELDRLFHISDEFVRGKVTLPASTK